MNKVYILKVDRECYSNSVLESFKDINEMRSFYNNDIPGTIIHDLRILESLKKTYKYNQWIMPILERVDLKINTKD